LAAELRDASAMAMLTSCSGTDGVVGVRRQRKHRRHNVQRARSVERGGMHVMGMVVVAIKL
jgi:hypothetical protein